MFGYVALPDKVRLRDHARLVSQLETRIPNRAFAGATLDLLYTGEGLESVDDATRDVLLDFAEDFLTCGCQGSPHCGHPERFFCGYVLELRADGYGPAGIVDMMGVDYHLTAYAGDVLTFLDEAIRQLEALEALASVDGNEAMAQRAKRRRNALEQQA